jgi:glycosyltransferase involved in cell wall biosynthesis
VRRSRPLIFDLTLSYRSLGAQPDGILRSERCFARELMDRGDLAVTFCRYDRHLKTLVCVSRSDAEFIVGLKRRKVPGKARGFLKVVRDLGALFHSREEIRYRTMRWDLRRFARKWFGRGVLSPASISPDSVLVLAGMVFDTHDVDEILRFKQETGIAVFAVCYDVLPIVHPEYFQSRNVVQRFRRQTGFLVSWADRIASISRSVRADLQDFARTVDGASPDLTTLVLGFDIPKRTSQGRPAVAASLDTRGYVLCVGNINIRKNHALLYRVWRRLAAERADDLPVLVIAGRIGWRADDVVHAIRTDPAVEGRIVMIHDADDGALAWLYENCRFTVYPSFYEGWGLPVSESLAFARHCLTSSSSSMPEAAAGLAATLDPNDDDAWAAAIGELLDHPDRLAEIESEIRSTFRLRSWSEASTELIEQALTTERSARPIASRQAAP